MHQVVLGMNLVVVVDLLVVMDLLYILMLDMVEEVLVAL